MKRNFMTYTAHQIFRRQIGKNEMGGTYSVYGIQERCIQGFGGET